MASSEEPKRGPGRPAIHGEPAGKLMRTRVTPSQFDDYNEAADTAGLSLSQWTRQTLDRAAARVLKRKAK